MDVRNRLASVPTQGRHVVEMLIRKGSLKPSDDSPFANEIFDPACEYRRHLDNSMDTEAVFQLRTLGSRPVPSITAMLFLLNTSKPTMVWSIPAHSKM